MPGSATLRSDLDVAALLRETATRGAAIAFDALDREFYKRLAHEVSTGPYQPMPEEHGRAQQEAEILRVECDSPLYPEIRQLGAELVRSFHGSSIGVEGVTEWVPNEVDVQRYRALTLGITPHLDHKRYRLLIVIVTVGDSAPFTLCKDRDGNVLKQWQAEARSLILLRAPGLGCAEDGRPLHAISGPPVGTRISITWRMNSHQ